jgi:Flp pilus assembly pilin Flp
VLHAIWRDQRGASLLEYTILIGLILLAVLPLIIYLGGWTSTTWTNFLSSLGR